MSMVINTNVASLASQRHLASSRAEMEQAMERLSSGKRINSAMDDAAGLTISHSLDSKIAGLNQAVRNANDGIALVNLAEGAMEEISSMLTRMKELATQSINGTYTTTDRTALNSEFEALTAEITRISEQTQFNGVDVLNSTTAISFQLGDTSTDTISVTPQKVGAAHIGDSSSFSAGTAVAGGGTTSALTIALATADVVDTKELRVDIGGKTFTQEYLSVSGNTDAQNQDATVEALIDQIVAAGIADSTSAYNGTDTITLNNTTVSATTDASLYNYTADSDSPLSAMNIKTADKGTIALTTVDRAIADVDSYRSSLGAVANRMEHASSNLLSRVEHQSAARSRIQDADYAVESANLAKAQVLQQAGTAMLSQANASTQNVLSLLK